MDITEFTTDKHMVKAVFLKIEQDFKVTFWKVTSESVNKIWGCMKCYLKESWYNEWQKTKCRSTWQAKETLPCPSLKLSSEKYVPASEIEGHGCKIPLLFLHVTITENKGNHCKVYAQKGTQQFDIIEKEAHEVGGEGWEGERERLMIWLKIKHCT